MLERIVDIIAPVFSIVALGWLYARRAKPDMPEWAQWIGTALPLTHFNRIVRGILLKGNGWVELWPSIWPLLIFVAVVMAIALRFYRRTLD